MKLEKSGRIWSDINVHRRRLSHHCDRLCRASSSYMTIRRLFSV